LQATLTWIAIGSPTATMKMILTMSLRLRHHVFNLRMKRRDSGMCTTGRILMTKTRRHV
jgi:hypothetical protein